MTRRFFLGAAGAAAAVKPRRAQAAGPNDTIRLGLIGCGARGRGVLIPNFQKAPGTRFTAVCDVNSKYLAEGREKAGGTAVAAYTDFRKLIEDKNVDVVIVGTNAQWHVLPTIAACQAGKDVYLEKPMGNSIGEGKFAIAAARKYDRIVQIGTQQRSQEHYQKAVDIIRSGKLGEISEVRIWDYENYWPGPGSPADCDPPAELDWDFYVGPSPWRAYNPNIYYKYGYDWFKVSGAGHQVAWGVHHFDVMLWALGVRSLRAVSAMGGNYAYETNHDWPNTFDSTVEFGPGPVSKRGFVLQYTMRVGGKREMRAHGKLFVGTQASMLLDRRGYSIVTEAVGGRRPAASGNFVSAEEEVLSSRDDNKAFSDFIENVRNRKQPAANLQTGHDATNVGHLMNIAWQVGRTVRWDGEAEKMIDDPKAQALVLKPYRAPWKLAV